MRALIAACSRTARSTSTGQRRPTTCRPGRTLSNRGLMRPPNRGVMRPVEVVVLRFRTGEFLRCFLVFSKPGEWRPEGCPGDRGINACFSRLCRESPLTAWRAVTLEAVVGEEFFHPRRLPHGECGVWGSAPGCDGREGASGQPGGLQAGCVRPRSIPASAVACAASPRRGRCDRPRRASDQALLPPSTCWEMPHPTRRSEDC